MKLVQFWKDKTPALGLQTPQGIIDVQAEAARRGLSVPGDMAQAIALGDTGLSQLAPLAEGAQCFADSPLAPVVTQTGRILCIGLNYRQHAKECGLPLPPAPVPFCKFSNALAAHGDAVKLMPDYKEYDYEAELVVVMGRPARDVSVDEALDYVYGYTCGDDLSTRDLQFARGGQWLLSKTFDGFAPIGPCLVPARELDPTALDISSQVNGQTRQSSNTGDMIFSVAQIIADLSRHFTLMPGDLIFTGTPQGVMQGYPADRKDWLKPGDRVSVTIQGIGTLENTFGVMLDGIIIGCISFALIGLFHPIVIWSEYHFSSRCWPAFLLAGLALLAGSVLVRQTIPSAALGVAGMSCLWSILELKEQEKRVARGWFPKKERKKST